MSPEHKLFIDSSKDEGQFEEVEKVVDEYFQNKHAGPVPQADLMKPPNEVM